MILPGDEPYDRVVVPDHKQLRPDTLRKILHEVGLTVEDLMALS